MSTIFHLDSSIRAVGSQGRAVASTLQDTVREHLREVNVITRDVGLSPLPPSALALATQVLGLGEHAAPKDPGAWTVDEAQAMALATELADEMLAADAYIFSVPLYNFGVSQHVKAWIDLLMTEPRFGIHVPSPVSKRPAYLIVARGGAYGPGMPRAGWDHATPWLRRIFEDTWGLDLHLIEVELTLAAINPEMASLRDLAAANLMQAHASARQAGERLAFQLAEPSASISRQA